MSFAWPGALAFLVAVPALLGGYLVVLRRRRRGALVYSSLALLRQAVPRRSRWLRHVPIVALLFGLGILGIASARPETAVNVPIQKSSIILALDTSGSMCSTDLLPDRLAVAQLGALKFVNSEPAGLQMGLVVFNGFAEIVVPPTTDRAALIHAIENLTTAPGTAIGAAVLQSLDAIAEIDPQVQPVSSAVLGSATIGGESGAPSGSTTTTTVPLPKPGAHGYVPDVIVLLTDGQNNRGIAPLQAAPYAIARKVRVYTIGYGTTHPGPLECTPSQQGGFGGAGNYGFGGSNGGYGGGGFGSSSFGGGGYGGNLGPQPLVADLPPLRELSAETGGLTFTARNSSELSKVFATLRKEIATQKEKQEVTADFALVGALFVLLAIGAAVRWGGYP